MDKQDNILVLAKTKLADRPVVWKEAYTKRTLFLKKQFHEVLGPGSYFRFEGHDTDSNDDYFVVVGPAKVHSPKAEFFAGVRKLPADYAAGGLYFHDLDEAMKYAHATWGVSIPKEIKYYDSNDLKNISSKVKKWKETIEDDENEEDYLIKWYEGIKKGEDAAMPISETDKDYFYAQSNTYPFFTRIAMPTWLRHEQGFHWWTINDLFTGNADFDNIAAEQPSLIDAKDLLLKEKAKRRRTIAEMYGPEYAAEEAGLYGVWLVHRGDRGTYIVSVGPYCGNRFEQALDKFGVFTKKLNAASHNEIQETVTKLLREYAEIYNVELDINDIKIPDDGSINPTVELNKTGRKKFYKKYKELVEEWQKKLQEEYAKSQESGEAFERQQLKPPDIKLIRRRIGQQQSRSILRQNVAGLTALEKIEKYGFESFKEAVDFLETTGMPGAPIGDIPPTTSDDLRKARLAKQKVDQSAGVVQTPQVQTPQVQTPQVKRPKEKQEEMFEEVSKDTLDNLPEKKSPVPEKQYEFHDDLMSDFAQTSLIKMIKMAEELDSKGKSKEAEEIHAILRKHVRVGAKRI